LTGPGGKHDAAHRLAEVLGHVRHVRVELDEVHVADAEFLGDRPHRFAWLRDVDLATFGNLRLVVGPRRTAARRGAALLVATQGDGRRTAGAGGNPDTAGRDSATARVDIAATGHDRRVRADPGEAL